MKKSRLFGLLALITCIAAVNGSHYYRFLLPLGTVLWLGFAATTFYLYRRGM